MIENICVYLLPRAVVYMDMVVVDTLNLNIV
jgi:hypothetical protein